MDIKERVQNIRKKAVESHSPEAQGMWMDYETALELKKIVESDPTLSEDTAGLIEWLLYHLEHESLGDILQAYPIWGE